MSLETEQTESSKSDKIQGEHVHRYAQYSAVRRRCHCARGNLGSGTATALALPLRGQRNPG